MLNVYWVSHAQRVLGLALPYCHSGLCPTAIAASALMTLAASALMTLAASDPYP